MGPEQLGGNDGPSLIVDGVRIPFQMEAHVTYGPPGDGLDDGWSDRDDDAPWMIHLPVELQVLIPHEILYPPTPAPPPPRPAPVGGGSGPAPGRDDVVPPGGGRAAARKRPVTVRALEGLGLGEMRDQRPGGRSGDPLDLRGLVSTGAADDPAADAGPTPDIRDTPAPTTGTTGHRAVDQAFARGGRTVLDRMLGIRKPV